MNKPIIWVGAVVVGFMIWWPIGLAALFSVLAKAVSGQQPTGLRSPPFMVRSSGNSAFDEHRQATLRQLEDDREAFGDFVSQLRRAKDRAEFDRFMKERR